MMSVSFGDKLRAWRLRRRMSQQELADWAGLSARHLSFLETGRATPSREMVLRLSDRLDVPLRERNPLLEAAGFAPLYRNRTLDAPEMEAVRRSLRIALTSLLPNPALVIDRCYDVVEANRAAAALWKGITAERLMNPLNVVRLSLDPEGLASRIVNFDQWRTHLLGRLERQWTVSGDAKLRALIDEVSGVAQSTPAHRHHPPSAGEDVFLPLELRIDGGILRFISMVTVFGTPHDITLQELAIESFFPIDDFTATVLARLAAPDDSPAAVG